jgi:hypothetical protein
VSRPVYETPQDRESQEDVIYAYARAVRLIPVRMPRLSVFDYEMHDGNRVQQVVEVKDRRKPFAALTRDGAYAISARKLRDLRAIARERHCTAWLVIRTPDGIHAAPIPCGGTKWERRMGGRTDRGDPQDIELMEFVPAKQFRRIAP